MYDVIVIGARAAGSPTAMLLAGQGYRVLCVDRSTFPSDTVSTHMITVEGSARLRRWGLLDRVEATGCPPVTNIELDLDFPRYGHFTLKGFPEPVDEGFAAIYAPKRTVLDKILVDAAAESGAEVREGFSVQEVLVEEGRVVGIRGRGADGVSVVERAHVVVGADGWKSLVARTVQAPEYHVAPPKAFGYYTYWAGVKLRGLEFYTRPGSTVIAFPTNDDHAAVFVERPERDFARFKKDLLAGYLATVGEIAPDLRERIAGGKLAHRILGAGNRPNFFRKPFGPGWALVGDAGAHKDPITAQGITDAFRDADLLSAAIHRTLGGGVSYEEAMRQYEEARNFALKPLYDFIVDHAAMEPFDDTFQDVLNALRNKPEELRRFFGVIQNTVHWSDFFTPESLSSVLDFVDEDALPQAS
jgi:flavin-dependent dehydrogenase